MKKQQLLDFFPNGQNILRMLEELLSSDFATLQAIYAAYEMCTAQCIIL